MKKRLHQFTYVSLILFLFNGINSFSKGKYLDIPEDYFNRNASLEQDNCTIDIVLDLQFAQINCFNEATGIVNSDVSGGVGEYTYTLMNNSTGVLYGSQSSSEFRGLSAGEYTYRVTSDQDCLGQQTFIITNPSELTMEVQKTNVSSGDANDGIITVFVNGGTGLYSFGISSNPNQFYADASDDIMGQHTFSNLAPGIYQVFSQDSLGCFQILEVVIEEVTPLTVDIDGPIIPETCYGASDGEVTITITGGTPPYFTNITNNDVDFVQDKTTYTGLPGGITIIFIKDANDLRADIAVEIPKAELLVVDISVTPVTDQIDGSIFINTSGGAAPYFYELLDPTGFVIATQLESTFSINVPGTYYVRVQDSNGCVFNQLVVVESIEQNPLLDYADNILFCALNGQSYPIITIQNNNGEVLDFSSNGIASIIWQKLDEINCDIILEDNCPTTDSSCSSNWFDICTTSDCTISDPGEYRIVIEFVNRSSKSSQTYYFRAESLLGINDLDRGSIEMYPNPAKNRVNINAKNQIINNITVLDVRGKIVMKSIKKDSFNITSLDSGVYFIKIESEKGESVLKLMKM